jgi:hypothetical protein
MPIVTIPFDYDAGPPPTGPVPICVADTDTTGSTVARGWIAAIVPVAERLRMLARKRLGDVWRVSELAEFAVHANWKNHGEDYGKHPHLRIYEYARWKAEDLRCGHWRVRKGLEISLGPGADKIPDPWDYRAEYEADQVVDRVRQELIESGSSEVAEMLDMVLHGCKWPEVAAEFGRERSGRTLNSLRHRYRRTMDRIVGRLASRNMDCAGRRRESAND